MSFDNPLGNKTTLENSKGVQLACAACKLKEDAPRHVQSTLNSASGSRGKIDAFKRMLTLADNEAHACRHVLRLKDLLRCGSQARTVKASVNNGR